jgi:hypothetical protein
VADIVLVYDRVVRQDTTGTHLHRALLALGHRVHHHAPVQHVGHQLVFRGYRDLPRGADLVLCVDDDLGYPGPDVDVPSAYWVIDVHRMDALVGPIDRWERVTHHDVVFSAQRDRAAELGCHWLPLGVQADVVPEPAAQPDLDWAFVGNVNTEHRRRVLDRLAAAFPRHVATTAFGPALFEVYGRALLGLNVAFSNDVNMRVFEATAAGAALLTTRTDNGEDELLPHLWTFTGVDDVVEVMGDLLADRARVREVGLAQRAHVLATHTYEARARQLLATVLDGAPPPPRHGPELLVAASTAGAPAGG